MIQVGVPISDATLALAQANRLDVDYVIYYGDAGLAGMQKFTQFKPLFLHDLPGSFWLNYENPFRDSVMTEARAMLDLSKSPWLSTGIGASAEPQAHRDGPYREANTEDLQSRETVIANILKHGRRLKAWAGVPLLLENYNYHPTNAYEYICEPELFTRLVDEIDCGMLLDLAHARISAHNMGWSSAERYLEALPLHKVREVHVTRPGWQGDQRVDLHQPLLPEDLPLLDWVLDHAPVEAVTVEIDHTIDEATLFDHIGLMRQFLNNRQN
jgi:uncharacterized protein (UPF0276 family)